MTRTINNSMKRIFQLALFALPTFAFAVGSSETITLNKGQSSYQTQVRGVLGHTIYRTESYETTCTREVPYETYETRCEPQYETRCHSYPEQECSTTTTRECSTEQVCRDVMREVCGPSGCQSYPTRECTNEQRCRDVPREVCRTVERTRCEQVRVQDRCWEERVVRYRTEEYSCTRTREVPIGTVTDEDRQVNATLKVRGDVNTLSGSDSFVLSVPNGIDQNDYGYKFELANSANTHLIYVRKVAEQKQSTGPKNTLISVSYEMNVVEKSKFKPISFVMETLRLNSGYLNATLSKEKIDMSFKAYLVIEKDQSIGGYKTLFASEVASSAFTLIEDENMKQKLSLNLSQLGIRFNNRPHRFTLKLEMEGGAEVRKDLANPQILNTMQLKTTQSKAVRVKM